MIPVDELIFLDTNILLSVTDEQRTTHQDSLKILSKASERGLHTAVSQQVLREYLVVATRPLANNGLGLTPDHALDNIAEFSRVCMTLENVPSAWAELKRLVGQFQLKGKRIHDANIIATMMAHGVFWLFSDNLPDFNGIGDIRVLSSSEGAAYL